MEVFTPIVTWKNGVKYDFTGSYEISNLGRVMSVSKVDASGHKRRAHIMRTYFNHAGYEATMLAFNSKRKSFSIARMVYESFNGEIPDGMQVNHIDENKKNNALTNLNIMTPRENNTWGTRPQRAGIAISNAKKGKPVYKSRIPIIQSSIDGEFVKEWDSAREVENKNGWSGSNIAACCRGKLNTAYGYKWTYK